MIDSQEEFVACVMPFRITFAFGKLQDFQGMSIWILEIESLDSGSVLVPCRQKLRTSRSMFDLVLPEPGIRLIHVAGNNSDMLEPAVVAARVNRDGAAFRCKILRQLDNLVTELHTYNSNAQAEHSLQSLVVFPGQLHIRHFLKR